MASLIDCPHCGRRPKEEFTIRGSAEPSRPAPNAGEDAWYEYVYVRRNPVGMLTEYWHHSAGCRRWLIVKRSSADHTVEDVRDAAGIGAGKP